MTTELWTVRKVLGWTAQHFEKQQVDSPRLTAELLLAHALGSTRVKLYMDLERPLSKDELAAYRGLIQRRAGGEPTEYLTRNKEFYGRRFQVDEQVLIPRPETELLVDAVLKVLPSSEPSRVLDLCTGSGCVAVTVACERPQAQVFAVELSLGAVAVARANAKALGVGDRVQVLEGDLFAPLPAGLRFDVVVANPPYIASAAIASLDEHVRREPRRALDGGTDGLDVVRRIVRGAAAWLRPGGLLALEIGDDQGVGVKRLLDEASYRDARVEKDLARLDRLALGRTAASDEPQV